MLDPVPLLLDQILHTVFYHQKVLTHVLEVYFMVVLPLRTFRRVLRAFPGRRGREKSDRRIRLVCHKTIVPERILEVNRTRPGR